MGVGGQITLKHCFTHYLGLEVLGAPVLVNHIHE